MARLAQMPADQLSQLLSPHTDTVMLNCGVGETVKVHVSTLVFPPQVALETPDPWTKGPSSVVLVFADWQQWTGVSFCGANIGTLHGAWVTDLTDCLDMITTRIAGQLWQGTTLQCRVSVEGGGPLSPTQFIPLQYLAKDLATPLTGDGIKGPDSSNPESSLNPAFHSGFGSGSLGALLPRGVPNVPFLPQHGQYRTHLW